MLQQHRKSVSAISYQREDPSSSQNIQEFGNNNSIQSFAADDEGLKISGYSNFEGCERVISMPSPLVEAIPTTSTSEKDFEQRRVVDAGTAKL